MDFNLVISYPWFILAIIMIALIYLVKWYYSFYKKDLSRKLRYFLYAIKYLSLFLIILYFFNPLLLKTSKQSQKPKHLFLIDQSKSVFEGNLAYQKNIKDLIHYLSQEKILTDIYSFDRKLSSLQDQDSLTIDSTNFLFTNLAAFEQDINLKKAILKKNYQSINLVTDANYNSGTQPLNINFNTKLNILYTGDSIRNKDLFIKNVHYLAEKEKENFEIDLEFKNLNLATDNKVVIKVLEQEKIIARKVQPLNSSDGIITIPILNDSIFKYGVNQVEFIAEELINEKNKINNKFEFIFDKINQNPQILILQNNYSFDLVFLKKILKKYGFNFTTANYQAEELLAKDYDLIIAYNPPRLEKKILEKLSKTNLIIFAGENTNSKILNAYLTSPSYTDLTGKLAQTSIKNSPDQKANFAYLNDDNFIDLSSLPPVRYNSSLILNSKKDNYSLLATKDNRSLANLHFQQNRKILIINLIDFWKLSFGILKIEDQSNFDFFFKNLVEYMLHDFKNEQVSIALEKEEYLKGESIIFKGNYLDANFNRIKNIDLKVKLKNLDNSFTLAYDSLKQAYIAKLDLNLDPNIYDYEVLINGKKSKITGSFKVRDNQEEINKLEANLTLIKELTRKYKGYYLPIAKYQEFVNKLDQKPIEKITNIKINITRNIVYFIILILLLVIEWIIRKIKDLA